MIDFIYKESKKRKTIGISVHPDGTVKVSAPSGMNYERVKQLVAEKSDWILKHQRKFLEAKSIDKDRALINGERHHFLGNKYELMIIENCNKNSVDIDDKFLYICVKDKEANRDRIRNLLVNWFSFKAETIIRNRVEIYSNRLNLKVADIKITSPKSYWGNCNRKGILRFNWRLVQAPEGIIDYVIVHELCHLKHFNHSARFWNMVEEIMPDYKQKKQLLKELAKNLSFNEE